MMNLIYSAIVMAILCYTCRRYKYIFNVLIYTAFMGLLPCLISFSSVSFLFLSVIVAFVFGLAVVAAYSALANSSDTPWIVIIGIFVNYIITYAMSFIITFLLLAFIMY